MCSQWMDNNYYQGDLTDIIRASNGGGSRTGRPEESESWELPMNFLANPDEDHGDPFTHFGDPFLRDTETQSSGFLQAATYFKSDVGFPVGAESPCPATEQRPLVQNDGFFISKQKMDGPDTQISSPRNTGSKRRKNQAKKVVCIPAPLPATARSSGEVVPSDLWAWRKYGQKPIKGSPFPRAYYKCSSSKGCSARKQVERSRTDPNMLVITYSSEHNHQWPTQRNALSGSIRSPTSKRTHKPSKMEQTPPSATVVTKSSSSSTVKKESGHHDATHNDKDIFTDSLEALFSGDVSVAGGDGNGVPSNPLSFFNWNWDNSNPMGKTD